MPKSRDAQILRLSDYIFLTCKLICLTGLEDLERKLTSRTNTQNAWEDGSASESGDGSASESGDGSASESIV